MKSIGLVVSVLKAGPRFGSGAVTGSPSRSPNLKLGMYLVISITNPRSKFEVNTAYGSKVINDYMYLGTPQRIMSSYQVKQVM